MSAGGTPALRAAIVGCGAIAHEHLTALASLTPAVEVVGVADRSRAAARFVADHYGVDEHFADLETMLDSVRPDVVHVLTPPASHVALVERCLGAGVHVVCEKPMTPNANETEALLARASDEGRILVESQNLRFNDQVRRIDHLIDTGRLGEVRCVDVTLSLDLTAGPFGDENLAPGGLGLAGGAVHDFLPHLVYLFEHFAEVGPGGVDDAFGRLENRSDNPRVGYDSLDVVVSSGQRRGLLRVASDLAPDSFRLIVRGTERSVETDFYNSFERIEGGSNVGKRAPLEQVVSGLGLAAAGFTNLRNKVASHGPMHGLTELLRQMYAAAAGRGDPPVTPEQIVATARSIDTILGATTPAEGSD